MDAPRPAPEEAGIRRPRSTRWAARSSRARGPRRRCGWPGRWLPGRAASAGDRLDARTRARPILLLHGWTGSVTPDLVEHAPFLRRTANVLGLDFRGHGGSDDGPTTFGVLEVEDVAGALAWLGERGIRRVALVGSSMGGITALASVAVLGDGRLAAADADPDAPAATVERAAAADRGGRRGVGAAGARDRRREPDARAVRAADRGPGVRADGADWPARDPRADAADRRRRRCSRTCRCCSSTGRRPRPSRCRTPAAWPPRPRRGTRTCSSRAPDTAQGHAADPVAYEAAVTVISATAFAMARA